ncbi:MAG: DNA polymerase III subunit delta [Acidobacteriota bacterium]
MNESGFTVLDAALGQAPPESLYLLVGANLWERERCLERLQRAVLGDGGLLGFTQSRAGDGRVADLLDAARTLPMGGGRRLIVLKDCEALEREDLEQLAAYAVHPQETTCLVLVADALPSTRKTTKILYRQGVTVKCPLLRAHEIPRWMASVIRRRGFSHDPGVPEILVETLGHDQATLVAGLETIALYLGGKSAQRITPSIVNAVLVPMAHGTVWEFIEALEEKNAPLALARLGSMLDLGESVESLLRLVTRSRKQLLAGVAARQEGGGEEAVLEAMGVHPRARAVPRVRRAILSRLARHTQDELVHGLDRVLDADSQMKGGGPGNPDVVLTRLVLDLCRAGSFPGARTGA